MTDERTFTLGEEADRLDAELDDVAAEEARLRDEYDDRDDEGSGDIDDDPDFQAVRQRASTLDSRYQAVAALADEHGAEAEVHLQGLTAGEHAYVTDRLDNAADLIGAGENQSRNGAESNHWAAMAVREAPFIPDEGGFEARLGAIEDQPPQVRGWLEAHARDLTVVEAGNAKPYAERVQAKRENQRQASDER